MKILILFQLNGKIDRNTIFEHLYSFRKYSSRHQFHYVNVLEKIPDYLRKIKYEAVILHYTFLAGSRFLSDPQQWEEMTAGLENIPGYKVGMPQDEYDNTKRLCKLFKKVNLKAVFTCFEKDEDIKKAYPFEITGVDKFYKVYTGYIDTKRIPDLKKKWVPYHDRSINIGYRARMLPANFGRHGQLKYALINVFNKAVVGRGLVTDIKSTNDTLSTENNLTVKHGESWYSFLLNCKAFIGCEGGSSLLDFDGSIKDRISRYHEIHPKASFDEIEEHCFKDQDYNISCFALSPRHFEAVMTKTLQILVEGKYSNIFKPWEHYIPLKKDFSNLEEVFEVLKDNQRCQDIIDKAFADIVLNDKYTYSNFVKKVFRDIEESVDTSARQNWSIKFAIMGLFIKWRNFLLLNKPSLTKEDIYASKPFKQVHLQYTKYLKPIIKRN